MMTNIDSVAMIFGYLIMISVMIGGSIYLFSLLLAFIFGLIFKWLKIFYQMSYLLYNFKWIKTIIKDLPNNGNYVRAKAEFEMAENRDTNINKQ
jgi:hypothetical protein